MAVFPTAAAERLKEYNSNAYDPATNPYGMALGGHRQNFPLATADVAIVGEFVQAAAAEADASASAAAASAAAAADARTLSQRWASNPEDVVVQAGMFSALHYSAKAQASAAAAATFDPANFYTRQEADQRYYTQAQANQRYYTKIEINEARWPIAKLEDLAAPAVIGRLSGNGAPGPLTPAQVMEMMAPILAGEYVFLPSGVIPAGKRILKANGATLVRADYPHLFAYAQNSGYMSPTEASKTPASFGPGNGSTTFTIPDARGYFLRAFDDGRGIDASRVISAIQASAMHQHSHTLPMGFGGATIYTWLDVNNAPVFGSEVQGGTSNAEYAAASTGGGRNSRLAWSSGVERQSGETRPVNLAATLGIRY
ncbi:phage tail protein [Aureimonas altamirensis]|uniref:phage tail protein n=1 Tax=Aureimonas altamirensis TaxID=370622 RepID=UPI0030176C32